MRIYQSLGTKDFYFNASELWDSDEEELDDKGLLVFAFVLDTEGPLSFDTSWNHGEGTDLLESIALCLENNKRTHNVPLSKSWWEYFAKFCYLHYQSDYDDTAAYHYRIIRGDDFESACDNWCNDGVSFYAGQNEDEVKTMKGHDYVEERDGCSDDLAQYVDWYQIGEDNYEFNAYAGGIIVVEDGY